MKKIVIALTILFFITGCQSAKDTKTTNQTTQEVKEEQKQKQDKTQQETNNTDENSKQETKEKSSKTTETKQQESSTSLPPSSSNKNTPPVSTPPVETKKYVTVVIDCKTILHNIDAFKEQYKSFVPSNGIILADTKVEYTSGDTVISVLKKVTKEKGIRMINQGGYVSNLANINQMGMQNGQGGWMYMVNGVVADVGADTYSLSNGDVVQWRYSCNPGDI